MDRRKTELGRTDRCLGDKEAEGNPSQQGTTMQSPGVAPVSPPSSHPSQCVPESHISQSEQNAKPRPSQAVTRGCMAKHRTLNDEYER